MPKTLAKINTTCRYHGKIHPVTIEVVSHDSSHLNTVCFVIWDIDPDSNRRIILDISELDVEHVRVGLSRSKNYELGGIYYSAAAVRKALAAL